MKRGKIAFRFMTTYRDFDNFDDAKQFVMNSVTDGKQYKFVDAETDRPKRYEYSDRSEYLNALAEWCESVVNLTYGCTVVYEEPIKGYEPGW